MDNRLIDRLRKGDIVAIDIETNSIDKNTCEILQISCAHSSPKSHGECEKLNLYIKPEGKYEIAKGAFEKHGLTKEFIDENGKLLKDVANDILDFIGDRDILVYNGLNFDLPILCRHFKSIGIDFQKHINKVYDSYLLECELNSHRLEDVYRKYYGNDMENAHNAISDCLATMNVFSKQLEEIEDFDSYADEHKIKRDSRFLDGVVTLTEDETLVFVVGKYKDRDVFDIYTEDPQYIKWMWNKEGLLFESTKNYIAAYCKMKKSQK